jgi:hypothetical protein
VLEADRATYYRVALSCLRFIEQRRPTGRRFGLEADARWVAAPDLDHLQVHERASVGCHHLVPGQARGARLRDRARPASACAMT